MKGNESERILGARESLEKSVGQIVAATSKLLEPLKELNDEQKDAVVTLGLLIQGITFAKRPPVMMSEDILIQFQEELNEICPPLGEITIAKEPCFEATVSYASAMQKCEDEGKSEEECPEAWGAGYQSIMCAMKKIEEIKDDIRNILDGQRPPKPIPWPIEHSPD